MKQRNTASAPLAQWLRQIEPGVAFKALTSLLPEAAIFVVNEKRDVLLWNEAAEALLGFEAGEVIGRHCLNAIRCTRCLQGCGIAEHGQVSDVPLKLHRKDGSPIDILKSGLAFFDEQGEFQGGIEVLRPATSSPTETPLPPPTGAIQFHGILTRDPALIQVVETIRNVAETEATVLIRGESGTGKELVARAIHEESTRRRGPFVAVNCGALTPSLLESELFGHVKGAFTGAGSDRPGIFVQAQHGTLFLDEVAELPLELQPKLLRVLQEREVVPVGGTRPIPVDVRVVAATHRALREEVKAGRFREDLMYRLRVVPLFLPALRERPADLELLLHHFITRNNSRGLRQISAISPEAMRALLDHRWPGNVREMQNVMEYAFAVGRGPQLRLDELPPEFREQRSPEPPSELKEEAELREALRLAHGNLNQAAEHLGLSRTTFWRLRKKYGL